MNTSPIHFCRTFVLITLSTAVLYVGSTPVPNQDSLKKLASANNHFALNLHRQLITDAAEENVFFSPLSLEMAFGMLLYGARGDTATELRNILGYQRAGLSDELVHLTFNRFLTEDLSKSSTKGYTMKVANGVLVNKQLQLLSDYKNAMLNLYQAPVQNADFARQASKVKNSINNWVKSKTNGKIQSLMEDLSPETVMLILNAVYFKGLWKIPFDIHQTSSQAFYNNGQESLAKNVDMMHMMETTFPFTSTDNYQVLELPYEGNVSMVIFLPTEQNGLPSLEASLTLEQFNSIRRNLRPTKVTISLPKFRIEFTKSLKKDLQGLGVHKAFQSADLAGISRATGLRVSEVVHKAFVNVDELGTEAAAATGLSITPYSGNTSEKWFIADHPFLFAIFHKKSDMILFMGRVNSL